MEPFYLSHDQFWAWFDRDPALDAQVSSVTKQLQNFARTRPLSKGENHGRSIEVNSLPPCEAPSNSKKMRAMESKVRHISETPASERADKRYIVLYGKHRPGKKNKVWEGDGYLTLLDGTAHLCDLKGRMVEEPTILDDVDLQLINDESDILIGNTEVQIIEVDQA